MIKPIFKLTEREKMTQLIEMAWKGVVTTKSNDLQNKQRLLWKHRVSERQEMDKLLV